MEGTFKHIGLFEGIGGFSLAASWMGWETIAWCEWNEFGQKVLNYHFPKAKGHGDITKTDFTIYRGQCDIVTGGFPCQPYSQAGKRKGKEDDRHLWPEMLRAIKEIQPSWIVGENVLGLVNWSGGLVFHEVQTDLEAAGYEVFPYVLPACAVNAPHRRDRVWFVAHRNSNGQYGGNSKHEKYTSEGRQYAQHDIKQAITTNANGTGRKKFNDATISNNQKRISRSNDVMYTDSTIKQGEHIRQKGEREFDRSNSRNGINGWENFPTQHPIRSRNDGLPCKLDGITFPKWRNESIKAYGNAIVPQVAYEIFKVIEIMNKENNLNNGR